MGRRRLPPGVFCVEAGWTSRLDDRTTVQAVFDVLRLDGVKCIHEEVHTVEGLRAVLNKWPQRQYEKYTIGYFAFHGSPGLIYIGRKKVPLTALAEILEGTARGKTIYFGSCSVLACGRRAIEDFRKTTGARGVLGYTKDVDWYPSIAFDLLLFDALKDFKHLAAAERYLKREYSGMIRKLGFRMYYG